MDDPIVYSALPYPSPAGAPIANIAVASGQWYSYGCGPGTSGNYQTINYNGQGPYTPTHR